MKILVTSYAYAPSVGGIETVTDLLTRAFAKRGHEVVILTESPAPEDYKNVFETIRQPGLWQIWKAVRAADVVWQNNISLKYLWAARIQRKPVAVTLACPVHPNFPRKDWKSRLKARMLKHCHIFAISRYVLNDVKQDYTMIGNPYDSGFGAIFKDGGKPVRDGDIVFLGRLVSDKGADLLLSALALLDERGYRPSCTIIGDGPERGALETQVAQSGLEGRVRFTGFLSGEALYREIARHRIMAVPSRWKEPFGVVALEGIAGGCVVVGSSGGGLADAIGRCGLTFENNDMHALAAALESLLSDPGKLEHFRSHASAHLEQFEVENQADRYLEIFEAMRRRRGS